MEKLEIGKALLDNIDTIRSGIGVASFSADGLLSKNQIRKFGSLAGKKKQIALCSSSNTGVWCSYVVGVYYSGFTYSFLLLKANDGFLIKSLSGKRIPFKFLIKNDICYMQCASDGTLRGTVLILEQSPGFDIRNDENVDLTTDVEEIPVTV